MSHSQNARYWPQKDGDAETANVILGADGSLWLKPQAGVGWKIAPEHIRILDEAGPGLVMLALPGDARLELLAGAAFEEWRECHGNGRGTSRFTSSQRNLGALALVLGLILVSIWGTYRYAIPALSAPIAHAVPDAIVDVLGSSALEQLDAGQLAPSKAGRASKAAVQALLDQLRSPVPIDLHFRSMDGIANAFALPDGSVIVTDALLNRLETDEIQAVLAHEIAHVIDRHGVQMMVRSAAIPLLIAAVTGDFTFLLEPAGILAVVLANQGYSRDMETEADADAVALLLAAGLDPLALARALETIALEDQGIDWLQSHPDTSDRIALIEALASGR